jgi:uncharacterized protein (DUF885 family)
MQAQAAKGIYIPKSVYPLLVEGAQNVITGAPHDSGPDSPIFADFKRRVTLLDLPIDVKSRLVEEAQSALQQQLQPAYEDLIRLLKTQAARTPITGGVWQLRDGNEFYGFLIRQFTTTNMTPEDIHEMGLTEVARAQGEMAALFGKLGFHGTVREFMVKIKTDPRQYVADDDTGRGAYLDRARGIVTAMQAKITDAFVAPAPLPLEVLRTEAYKEASSPPGFYEAGTADGSRPGRVYLNLSDMHLMPLYELDDLLYHEGVPGHHMQISIAQTLPNLPKFRLRGGYSSYAEGWALYSEELGKEIGFYKDPVSDYGRLNSELFRAVRLVVDTGIHDKNWTREKVIDFMHANDVNDAVAQTETDRYIAWPGQALAYKMGQLMIRKLRDEAKTQLGPKFDIKAFHDQILDGGAMPLDLLQERVQAWIKAQGPKTASAP